MIWLWLLALGLFLQLSGLLLNNDGSRYATQLYLLLFLPTLLLLCWQRFAVALWLQPAGLILLGLFAWVLVSAEWVATPSAGALRWLKTIALILLYLFAVASLVRHERAFTWLLLAVATVAAVFAWWTLVYQFGVLGKPLDYEVVRHAGRLRELGWNGLGDLDHPIVAGLYYGVFAVILSYLFVGLEMKAGRALLLALGMCGLLAYLLLTFSRGAWFATGAGGLLTLLLFPNTKSRSLLAAGLLILLVGAWLFWPELQNEKKVGFNNRGAIWDEWLVRFPDFWLLGSGAGADFNFAFPPPSTWTVKHAHSLYLQFWYEYGVPGIGLFAALLLSLLWKGWICRRSAIARLGLALLGFALVGMVSDIYAVIHRPSPYWVVFWLPVGILLGVRPPAEERAA